MAYKIVFKKSARKELKKLDKTAYTKIRRAIDGLADNPRPRQSRKLQGAVSLWRLKIGELRVIYDIEDSKLVVLVVKVAHRREVYRGI